MCLLIEIGTNGLGNASGMQAFKRSTYDRRRGNEGADASHFPYQLADEKSLHRLLLYQFQELVVSGVRSRRQRCGIRGIGQFSAGGFQ